MYVPLMLLMKTLLPTSPMIRCPDNPLFNKCGPTNHVWRRFVLLLSPGTEYPNIETSNLYQAHLPASSTQVPRFLLDLVCHKSTEHDSHLAIYKFKPPPYPGFLLTTLIHTCPRHMQRPEKLIPRKRHSLPSRCQFPRQVDVSQYERHSGADVRDHVFNDAFEARE